MSGLHTSTVRVAHVYTRSDTPWIIDAKPNVCGRLFHYLSGGGMRTFGRTVRQEKARAKHRRFLAFAGAFAVAWVLFYFI